MSRTGFLHPNDGIHFIGIQPSLAGTEATNPGNVDRFHPRPDGRIAYSDRGVGPLVFLVPGLGDRKEEYRILGPRLASAGYRVVAMDLRGHGQSSVGWRDYSSSAIGSDIVALLGHLDAGPAVIIGTSMGAGAAVWAAAEAPDMASRLVLIGPFVREVPTAAWKKAMMNAIVHTAFAGPWGPAAWGMYYASLYPTAKPADFAQYREELVANLKEPGRMAALKAMLAAPKTDVERRLAEVRAPTLVIMGTNDPDFDDPEGEAATVASLIGGSVVTIDGAGHYPHAEMPDKTTPAILSFLAEGTRS
jgi:pimeloyl-ACP methyl ester carboxylesterase